MDVAGKRYRCRGCGQLLTFDADGMVPAEQLAACLGRCDWSPVEDRAAPPAPTRGSAAPPTAAP